jgi:DNA-binding Xre family transcriptional regulator
MVFTNMSKHFCATRPEAIIVCPDRAQGGNKVRISYNKLWHLMLDKEMNKADLKRATGISTASIAKLRKGENVTTDILVKICEALECELSEIMELAHDEPIKANGRKLTNG